MVGQEEVVGGCDAAPCATDGAAAQEGFGVEAGEDLPGGDLIWKADEERRRSCCCGLRHGRRRMGAHPGRCSRSGGAALVVEAAAEGRGMDRDKHSRNGRAMGLAYV